MKIIDLRKLNRYPKCPFCGAAKMRCVLWDVVRQAFGRMYDCGTQVYDNGDEVQSSYCSRLADTVVEEEEEE